jgi:hypothetical protein
LKLFYEKVRFFLPAVPAMRILKIRRQLMSVIDTIVNEVITKTASEASLSIGFVCGFAVDYADLVEYVKVYLIEAAY